MTTIEAIKKWLNADKSRSGKASLYNKRAPYDTLYKGGSHTTPEVYHILCGSAWLQ